MRRAFLHPAHVRVDGQDGLTQRKVPDRRSRVRPDARQIGEIVRPTMRRDLLRCAMQVQPAPVVAEPLPGANDLRGRSRGERLDRGPPLQPGEVPRDDSLDLGLLQHDLGNENRIRVSGLPPRQVAAVLREPGEQGGLHGPGL